MIYYFKVVVFSWCILDPVKVSSESSKQMRNHPSWIKCQIKKKSLISRNNIIICKLQLFFMLHIKAKPSCQRPIWVNMASRLSRRYLASLLKLSLLITKQIKHAYVYAWTHLMTVVILIKAVQTNSRLRLLKSRRVV